MIFATFIPIFIPTERVSYLAAIIYSIMCNQTSFQWNHKLHLFLNNLSSFKISRSSFQKCADTADFIFAGVL